MGGKARRWLQRTFRKRYRPKLLVRLLLAQLHGLQKKLLRLLPAPFVLRAAASKPAVTHEEKAQERAAELALNAATHQQVNRAMQVAAERLAAENTQRQALLLPARDDPAQRRAILRERVRAMEESGNQVAR